jgi:hypothetical protein
LFSIPDIAAMKLAVIAGHGQKRDFIDIFFLLKKYSLPDLMNFYNRKYPDGSELMIARSLTYFDDADKDENVVLLKKAEWKSVKEKIKQAVRKTYMG